MSNDTHPPKSQAQEAAENDLDAANRWILSMEHLRDLLSPDAMTRSAFLAGVEHSQRWIPCSEVPEKSDAYWTLVDERGELRASVSVWHEGEWDEDVRFYQRIAELPKAEGE